MFWNTCKITFRHLWRQKLFTGLNVLGLAIGICVCWVIYSLVSFEFSFEKDFSNKENTCRLVSVYKFDERESSNGGVPKPVCQEIWEQIKGVDRVVPVFEQFLIDVEIPNQSAKAWVVNFKEVPNIECCILDLMDSLR